MPSVCGRRAASIDLTIALPSQEGTQTVHGTTNIVKDGDTCGGELTAAPRCARIDCHEQTCMALCYINDAVGHAVQHITRRIDHDDVQVRTQSQRLEYI